MGRHFENFRENSFSFFGVWLDFKKERSSLLFKSEMSCFLSIFIESMLFIKKSLVAVAEVLDGKILIRRNAFNSQFGN